MSLATPLWLLLGLLGLLVVVLHLRRRRTVEISSIRLWHRIVGTGHSQVSWKPPRPNLLMVLQLLALLLIVLALARPLWSSAAQSWDHWIIVLDNSGSMQATDIAPSRFGAARDYLQTVLLEQLEPGGKGQRISLVIAGAHPYLAGARLARTKSVQAALNRVPSSAAPTSWRKVAALLPDLLVAGESVKLSLLTDGTEQGEAAAAIAEVLPNTAIDPVIFGSSASEQSGGKLELNIALTEVVVSPLELAEGRWQVSGHLQRFVTTPSAVTIDVFFEPKESEGALAWTSVEIGAGEDSFAFELSLPGPGVLELRLPDDLLAPDNHAYFVLLAERQTARVLHVGPDNPPLRRALEAIPNLELFQASELPSSSAGYDLVIIDRTSVSRHPATNTLWLGVMPPQAAGEMPTLTTPNPTGWRNDHPLADAVDWSTLSVAQAREMPRLAGAEVLVEAAGSPLIQVRTTHYGREVVTVFSLQETNWIEQLGFPVFMANLVQWVVPNLGQVVAASCQAGQVCPLKPEWLLGDWTLLNPAGRVVPLPYSSVAERGVRWLPRSFTSLFRPLHVGLYTLRSADKHYPIAVNAFYPQESELRPSGLDDASRSPAAIQSAHSLPLWFWPLLVALFVLVFEGWLAGRGAERFLRHSALARGNPVAARRRLILTLRFLTLVFLLMALFKVPGVFPTRESYAVFVVDDPQLYGADARARLGNFIASATRVTGRDRQGGLVQLGAGSQIISDLGSALQVDFPAATTPGADLEGALSLAAAMLPEASPGRIALATNGMQTRGSVAEVLPRLVAREIPVDVYPVGGVPVGEVLVEEVTVPSQLYPETPFLLEGIVYAERATMATVRIWREGEVLAEQVVELLPGRNHTATTVLEEEPGSYLYEMEIVSDTDVFPQNNRAGVVAEIASAANVVIFTPQPSWGEVLAKALELYGLAPEVLTPNQAPWDLAGWLEFDVVILMNLPALEFHSEQQELLERWVSDFGGGLILLGGENSFGPGGYYQTALERLSPLSSRVPQEAPQVAILFVLDRSGSMQQRVGGVTRLNIAKEATLEAVQLLNEQSLVGIVVFDSKATVLVPMQSVQNKAALASALTPLQPGGGTSLYPALVKAFDQMRTVEAMARHIVVMTDGLSQPGDFEEILTKIADAGITVSTVAVGQGADTRLLRKLAQLGGGTFHATTDVQALPSILAQEALSLSNNLVKEESFKPTWLNREVPFVSGLPATLPPLHGYVRTTAKPQAAVHLQGPEEAPLLASWRYGLGRVVAFASHGTGPWALDWLSMPEYPLLWAQAVRWVLPVTAGPGLHLSVTHDLAEARLIARAIQPDGKVHSGLKLEARIIPPGHASPFSLALRETKPGRYESSFVLEQTGSYQIQMEARDSGKEAGSESADEAGTQAENDALYKPTSTSLYVGYPARYKFSRQGTDMLAALAQATGGRVLLGDESIFPKQAPLRWVVQPAWHVWALLALTLFIADLLVRYAPGIVPLRRHSSRQSLGYQGQEVIS